MARSRMKGRYLRKDISEHHGMADLENNTHRLLYLILAIQTVPGQVLNGDARTWRSTFDLMDITRDECASALADWKRHENLVIEVEAGIVLAANFLGPAAFVGTWISREDREAIYERDGYACRYCRSTKRLSLDHVVPRIRGGTDDASNLVTACRSCNSRKHARTPAESGLVLLPVPSGVN